MDKREEKKERKKAIKDNVKKSNKLFGFFHNINRNNKNLYNIKEVIIIMLFSLGIGFFTCFLIITIFNDGRSYFTINKDLNKFIDAYYAIVDNYYGDIDKDELLNSAIEAMVNSVGDNFTNYSNSETATSFLETVEGTYEGIGCTISKNEKGETIIVNVTKDGPSEKAGLMVDDIILKIDDIETKDKNVTELSNYIRNKQDKNVNMKIIRNNEEINMQVTKTTIEIQSVTSDIIEKNNKKIGYINISIFSSVTDSQFNSNLDYLQKNNIDGLIIDVRNNGGGYLSSVTNIANRILKKDKIIYQLESDNKIEKKKDTTKESLEIPIAVLTNEGSASASEILAAAIKESYGGYIVGTNTYGKGTVQQTAYLSDGSMLKYTVQNWLTPNGIWINDVGLEPTNFVELSEEYIENPTIENDNQLQTALYILTK